MDLKEKIKEDLRNFIKENKKIEISALRMLLAAILVKEKEKRADIVKKDKNICEKNIEKESQLDREEIIKIIFSEIKKRKESILNYEKGERQDLAEEEKEELKILEKYLPEQIKDDEIEKIAKEIIEKTEASEIKDMGRVMKETMNRVKGKADGARVSSIVKNLLS